MNYVTKLLLLVPASLLLSACIIVNAESIDYEATKQLSLDADNIEKFEVDAGAGSLVIIGEQGRQKIEVQAELFVEQEYYELSLEKRGTSAVLVADANTRNYSSWNGQSPRINLIVKAPKSLALHIVDGSGNLEIKNFASQVFVKDGSGHATIGNIEGDLTVDDGSGSLEISYVSGNLNVEDGSGSLEISHVGANLVVDDGSGSTLIEDVAGDASVEDGSGGLTIARIKGHLEVDDGSGGIEISDVEGGLTLHETGSGSLKMSNVNGTVVSK